MAGGTVVGMTGMPEASVARELAMCFTTVCLVTDHDAGVDGGEAVTHAEVLGAVRRQHRTDEGAAHAGQSRRSLASEPDARAACACRRALDGQPLPFELP